MSANDSNMKWAWQNEDRIWNLFPTEVQDKLKEKFNKQKTATFPLDGKKSRASSSVKLDFQSMNLKQAKHTWKVCCCFKDSDKFYTWSWEPATGETNYFSASHVMELERAAKAGESVVGCVMKDGEKASVDLASFLIGIADCKYKVHHEEILLDDRSATVSTKQQHVDEEDESSPLKCAKLENGATASGLPEAKVCLTRLDKPTQHQSDAENLQGKTSESQVSNSTQVDVPAPPVDPACTQMKDKAAVYVEGDNVYDVMLNQTNLQFNNNKFMALQVLKLTDKEHYYAWFRWGRVGQHGRSNLVNCGKDKEKAKVLFLKKFREKTLNDWEDRKQFVKREGKYDMVIVDRSTKKDFLDELKELNHTTESDEKQEEKPSELETALQNLMSYMSSVSDIKTLKATLESMRYDFVKAPLGKLTDEQIQMGYKALSKIENCIKENNQHDLLEACNEFYTRIPHDFGMKRPPKITTLDEVSRKVKLLEALSDVQVTMDLMRKERELKNSHPYDKLYFSLGCSLCKLEPGGEEHNLISTYMKNTHGKTHTEYNLELISVYRVHRKTEVSQFKELPNRMLLWHGSRASNWTGILSQGLRIAPPEAPVTGYMFGKGVYFADCVSKSANYCFPHLYNNKGLLVLSEVSLGKCRKLYSADYNADTLPKGHHSVMGMGKNVPNPDEFKTMSDGVVVPCGRLVTLDKPDKGVAYSLLYNEYIVYDVSQIKMKYLIWVNFAEQAC
ncbi:poly [ADP-ribose] polymerase 2-like isoform X2 [Ornithodoros turicata]